MTSTISLSYDLYMYSNARSPSIGAIPLSMGLACGELVLTVAVLSILLTAPFGALGIDAFLEITESCIDWTYEMTNNVKLDGDIVTFDVSLDYFESCTVEAKIGKVFLDELTVEVKIQENGRVHNKSLTYKYINPGKKPHVSLPEDIDDYCYYL